MPLVPPRPDALAVALSLAAAGWYTFPFEVHEDGTKRPPLGFLWKEQATTDPERLVEWWGTFGEGPYAHCWPAIHTGRSGLVVVDLDQAEGKDGAGELRDSGLPLPLTSTFPSRRAGTHHYYRAPRGVQLAPSSNTEVVLPTGEVRTLPGVDIRAGDSLVVYYNGVLSRERVANLHLAPAPDWTVRPADSTGLAAPSATLEEWVEAVTEPYGTPSGRVLERSLAIRTTGTDHDTMRDTLLVLVRFAEQGDPGVAGVIAAARERYLTAPYGSPKYASAFDKALEGAIRHVGLPLDFMNPAKHAATVAQYQAWEEAAEAAEAEGVPVPPEPEVPREREVLAETPADAAAAEFERDVREALRRKLVGQEAERRFLEANNPGSFDLFDSVEALEAEDVEVEPIVDGLLYPGTVAIWAGTGGTGKTTALAGIAMAMGEGREWLGRRVKRGRVLFVEGEAAHKLPKRLRAWSQSWGDERGDALAHVQPARGSGINATRLEEIRRAHTERPWDLIVFDTASSLFAVKNENDNGEVAALLREVRKIVDADRRVCVVIVHHTTNSKDDRNGRWTHKARGASAWRDNSDTVVMQFGTKTDVTISTDPADNGKQRDESATAIRGLALKEMLAGVVLGTKTAADLSAERMKLHAFLSAGFGGDGFGVGREVTSSEWAEASGYKRTEHERLRDECLSHRLVDHDDRNRKSPWTLTQRGFEFVLNPLVLEFRDHDGNTE